ncbi:MAG: helix-turn-helix domain-containing protein [Acidobacteriia bacterium]|nr:helix-turn-helix domain-containing protein [Terriglobia bacterium]
MPKAPDNDPKMQALRQSGTLNPRPQDVRDELFREKEFFDARDLLQVKYEMLRHVSQEGHSISHAAASFGFSRPSFYQAQSAFETSGLAGLVPQKRGPKQGHKLTTEILEFVRRARAEDAEVRTADLVQRVRERFGVELHSRTIERGLLRDQKKRR